MNKIDEKCLKKAKKLFCSGNIDTIEVGTTFGLRKIRKYIFDYLHDFAGKIRTKNI